MCKNKYSVKKVKKNDLISLYKVCRILYLCGRDMASKYSLHHWDNSYLKNWLIVLLCNLKNSIYLVYGRDGIAVATFQISNGIHELCFKKLATNPDYMGKGIGTFCLSKIEEIAMENKYKYVVCEVYEKSEHAKRLYENKGYFVYGITETLKYRELKMRKEI